MLARRARGHPSEILFPDPLPRLDWLSDGSSALRVRHGKPRIAGQMRLHAFRSPPVAGAEPAARLSADNRRGQGR